VEVYLVKNFITNNKTKKAFVIIFWLLIWEIAAVLINQPLYLPSVSLTFSTFFIMIFQLYFWQSVLATFMRVLIGLTLSFIVGITLAVLSAKSNFISMLFSPFLSTMKAIPTMSIIILALVWLSTDLVPVFVCFILCFPIFYTNTLNGIKNIDIKLIELCTIYQISDKKKLIAFIIPSVKPYIMSALMICIGLAWKSVIAAEVLSAPKFSMGYKLYTTKMYLDIPELFAWTIAVVAFSMIIEKTLRLLFLKKGDSIAH
jgi:NitT/TauT family transport system permease protein